MNEVIKKKYALDNRKIYPVTVIWASFMDDYKVPIFFSHKVKIMEAFTQYTIYEAKDFFRSHLDDGSNMGAYWSHIRMTTYALKSLAEFLRKKRIIWEEFDDDLFEEYRENEYKNILSKKSTRDEKTAQDTVNVKIKAIYKFFWWAQEEQLLIVDQIGWSNCVIQSKLIEFMDNPENFQKDNNAKKQIYPMLYRRTGTRSKGRRGHYATDDELALLKEYFRDTCTPMIAERNILIVDIIEHIGWRQGSVRSLNIDQFSDELIEVALNQGLLEFDVVPPQQKMSYQDTYSIKLQIAIRINEFINTTRRDILGRINLKDECAALFVSYTTGEELGLTRISRIIADAFAANGAPKGSGPHSIRRKFGKEKATEILQVRHRHGMSTDPADVTHDLASSLGHSGLAAQEAYTAGKLDMYKESVESNLRGRLAESQADLAKAEREIAQLRKEISKIKV